MNAFTVSIFLCPIQICSPFSSPGCPFQTATAFGPANTTAISAFSQLRAGQRAAKASHTQAEIHARVNFSRLARNYRAVYFILFPSRSRFFCHIVPVRDLSLRRGISSIHGYSRRDVSLVVT